MCREIPIKGIFIIASAKVPPLQPIPFDDCTRGFGRLQGHDVGAFERGPISSIRGKHTIPERRIWSLYRFQHHRYFVEFVELAAEREFVRRQSLLDDPQGFRKLTRPVRWIDPEEADLDGRNAATYAELETAAAHLVQHADLFDQPDRMIQGQ